VVAFAVGYGCDDLADPSGEPAGFEVAFDACCNVTGGAGFHVPVVGAVALGADGLGGGLVPGLDPAVRDHEFAGAGALGGGTAR